MADSARLRRSLPRQPVSWEGKYRIEGGTKDEWRPCHLVDISTLGAGVELSQATPDETEERSIVVTIELRGTVKNTVQRKGRGVRVGIQFDELAETERAYLESLALAHAHW
jgi:hypothetical protein